MPKFELIQIDRILNSGTVDGTWIQGINGVTLEEAQIVLAHYAKKGRGARFALIEGYGAWLPPGHRFYNVTPLGLADEVSE